MKDMMIRKAFNDDVAGLAILFNEYRIFYGKDSDVEAATIFLTERIKNLESEIFIAVSNDGSFVGFVQLYPLFSSTRMKRLWLLNDLYVHPEYRGQGVSLQLIDKAMDLAIQTKAAGLMLETAKNNDIGNALYLKTGFVVDKDHNFYSWDV